MSFGRFGGGQGNITTETSLYSSYYFKCQNEGTNVQDCVYTLYCPNL